MKIKTKLLVYILLTNIFRDGISTANFKCDTGYKLTKGGEEFVKVFSETTCSENQNACISAKGSFVVEGTTCKLLQTYFKQKIHFKTFKTCFFYKSQNV